MDLNNTTLIITGGGNGFGEFLSRFFSKHVQQVLIIEKDKTSFSKFFSKLFSMHYGRRIKRDRTSKSRF